MSTASKKIPKPHGRRYPWHEWLARAYASSLVLKRGRDFETKPHGMSQTLRNAAREHGYKSEDGYVIHVSFSDDYQTLTVRITRA